MSDTKFEPIPTEIRFKSSSAFKEIQTLNIITGTIQNIKGQFQLMNEHYRPLVQNHNQAMRTDYLMPLRA